MQFQFLYAPKNGVAHPSAAHEEDEVLLCLSGQSTLVLDGREWPLVPGNLVCIPAGAVHRDITDPESVGAVLLFSKETGLQLTGFYIFQEADTNFQDLFRMALRSSAQQQAGQALASALGMAILRDLQCRGAVSPIPSKPEEATISEAIRQLRTRIRQQFTDAGFDLTSEIRHLGYSTGYFRRVFQNAVGRSPSEELRRMRLIYARAQLLRSASRSISEISASVGFRDPYYFSKLFKQFSGLTPTEFQRRYGGNPGAFSG